jgi:solute carrier family 24 (sodium/potassium/calcium exchanger), member 6
MVAAEPLSEEPQGMDDMDDDMGLLHASIPSIPHAIASPTIADRDTESQQFPTPTRRQIVWVFLRVYSTLFPSLHHFKIKTFLGKTASILAAPAFTALTLTLPVVVIPYENCHISREKTFGSECPLIDFEEEGMEQALIAEEEVEHEMHDLAFNKWLLAAQSILGPLFCAGVITSMCTRLITSVLD